MTTPARRPLLVRWQTFARRYGFARRFRAGEHLYRQGDSPDFVLLVVRGLVKLTVTSGEGHETLQSMHGAGEFVGLELLNPGLRRHAGAVCVDVVEGWYFSAANMSKVLAEAPVLYGDIVSELSRANARLANRLALHAVPGPQRVARVLVELAELFGAPHEDRITLPPLSQPEISSLAGTNLRTTERALRDFGRAGLLVRRYRRIDVVDLSELRRRGGTAALEVSPPSADDNMSAAAVTQPRETLTVRDRRTKLAGAERTTPGSGSYVEFGGDRHDLNPTSRVTFGRAADCTIRMDESDVTISRYTGVVYRANDVWWVENLSGSRPLEIIDELGLRSLLPPARRMAVEQPTRIAVSGQHHMHYLKVHVPSRQQNTDLSSTADTPSTISISLEDRLALTALFSGYLEDGPRYDPLPRTYEAAAFRLGWPSSTLRKRVEYLRKQFATSGVSNFHRATTLAAFAECVLTSGMIGKADLTLLMRPSSQEKKTKTT